MYWGGLEKHECAGAFRRLILHWSKRVTWCFVLFSGVVNLHTNQWIWVPGLVEVGLQVKAYQDKQWNCMYRGVKNFREWCMQSEISSLSWNCMEIRQTCQVWRLHYHKTQSNRLYKASQKKRLVVEQEYKVQPVVLCKTLNLDIFGVCCWFI